MNFLTLTDPTQEIKCVITDLYDSARALKKSRLTRHTYSNALKLLHQNIYKDFEQLLCTHADSDFDTGPLIEEASTRFWKALADIDLEQLRVSGSIFLILSNLFSRYSIGKLLPTCREYLAVICNYFRDHQRWETLNQHFPIERAAELCMADSFALQWAALLVLIPFKINDNDYDTLVTFGLTQLNSVISHAYEGAIELFSSLISRITPTDVNDRLFTDLPTEHLLAVVANFAETHCDKIRFPKLSFQKLMALLNQCNPTTLKDQISELRVATYFSLSDSSPYQADESNLAKRLLKGLISDSVDMRLQCAKLMTKLIEHDGNKIVFANKLFLKVLEENSSDQLKSATCLLATELLSLYGKFSSMLLQDSLLLKAVASILQSSMDYSTKDTIAYFFWKLARLPQSSILSTVAWILVLERFQKMHMFDDSGQIRRAASAVIQEIIGRGLIGDRESAAKFLVTHSSINMARAEQLSSDDILSGRPNEVSDCCEIQSKALVPVLQHSAFGYQFVISNLIDRLDEYCSFKTSINLSGKLRYILSYLKLSDEMEEHILLIIAKKLLCLPRSDWLEWRGIQRSQILLAILSSKELSVSWTDSKRIIVAALVTRLVKNVIEGVDVSSTCPKRMVPVTSCNAILILQHAGAQSQTILTLLQQHAKSHNCKASAFLNVQLGFLKISCNKERRHGANIINPLSGGNVGAFIGKLQNIKKACRNNVSSSIIPICCQFELAVSSIWKCEILDWLKIICEILEYSSNGANFISLIMFLIDHVLYLWTIIDGTDRAEAGKEIIRSVLCILVSHPFLAIRDAAITSLLRMAKSWHTRIPVLWSFLRFRLRRCPHSLLEVVHRGIISQVYNASDYWYCAVQRIDLFLKTPEITDTHFEPELIGTRDTTKLFNQVLCFLADNREEGGNWFDGMNLCPASHSLPIFRGLCRYLGSAEGEDKSSVVDMLWKRVNHSKSTSDVLLRLCYVWFTKEHAEFSDSRRTDWELIGIARLIGMLAVPSTVLEGRLVVSVIQLVITNEDNITGLARREMSSALGAMLTNCDLHNNFSKDFESFLLKEKISTAVRSALNEMLIGKMSMSGACK